MDTLGLAPKLLLVPQVYLKKQQFFGLTFWPNIIKNQTNKKKSSWLPLLRGTSDMS